MYCVKCGVRLDDNLSTCPLCGTPVWRPDEVNRPPTYSSRYPLRTRSARLAEATFLTILLVLVALICMIFCLHTYGRLAWAGYVMLGAAVFYTAAVLPLWLRKPNPVALIPIVHAALGGYLLYINLMTGGHWFLPFAFPLVLLSALLMTGCVTLLRYTRRGRLFITGGMFILIGGCSMLVELFQHITFGSQMFTWSLYVVSGCCLVGIFFMLGAFVRPIHEWITKKFFY